MIHSRSVVPLDPKQPQSLAKSCEVLLDAVDAKSPRWRYAVINLPHELLASGLVILDTAGYTTLASEPELSFHRVPDAAATRAFTAGPSVRRKLAATESAMSVCTANTSASVLSYVFDHRTWPSVPLTSRTLTRSRSPAR